MPSLRAIALLHPVPLLLGLLLAAPAAPAADEAPPGPDIKALKKELRGIERDLRRRRYDEGRLKDWLARLTDAKTAAGACVEEVSTALADLEKSIESLGEPAATEPPEVKRKRAALAREKAALEKRQASCRLLSLQAEELLAKVGERHKALLAQRLLARGPPVWSLAAETLREPVIWRDTAVQLWRELGALWRMPLGRLGLLVLLLALAAAIGLWLRRGLLLWLAHHFTAATLSARFTRALFASLAHYAPHLLFASAAAGFALAATAGADPAPLGSVAAYGLPFYFLLLAAIHLFLQPLPPAQSFVEVPGGVAVPLARRLKVLATLLYVGYLLFATILERRLPETAFLLARGVFAGFFVANLMWAVWLVGGFPRFARALWRRLALQGLLVMVLVAEWWGWRNLSERILLVVIGTLGAVGLLVLVNRMFQELYQGLEHGTEDWHRAVRRALGLKAGDHFPGLRSLRLLTLAAIWAGFAWLLLKIWGISDPVLQEAYRYLVEGFTVGSLTIVPSRLLLGALAFTLLLAVAGWFRTRLERRWLPQTRLDHGAREAIAAITGYSGVAIAALVGLGVAGFEFTNLAIVAGALSLGIGFGLQNVVNNFVSGLILLFERPIRTGDWISVGDTEGYVRKIRIRSTQIQTFDKADVIVPNSDLISGQVTNWMLGDPRGRVRVPVGVAYGSDTQLVKRLLLQVAREHPDVITDGTMPEPWVLFRAFGDSALEFELRAYIRNIDRRLMVVSDLNFAIDAMFREHGIEIPFPQRDLHLRSWDPDACPPAGPRRPAPP